MANVLAFVALLLYAARGVAPPFLSIEMANELLAGSISAIYIGFRRFFSRKVPATALAAGLVLVLIAVATFHYGFDSIAIRTVAVSIFHAAVCFAIGLTIFQAPKASRSRYPCLFTGSVAMLLAFGHIARGTVYGMNADVLTSSLQASGWNLFFLSVGTLVLPVLTMGAVMMVHDAMMAKAEHAASRDFLTGAYSRGTFMEMLTKEVARAQRHRRPLALLMLDLDNFKSINDHYGHLLGDRVISDFVSRTNALLRQHDFLGRYGGEEFIALLPETALEEACAVAERIRASIAASSAAGLPSYTVSIGVAAAREGNVTGEILLLLADKELYVAKHNGRNRIEPANRAMPATTTADTFIPDLFGDPESGAANRA